MNNLDPDVISTDLADYERPEPILHFIPSLDRIVVRPISESTEKDIGDGKKLITAINPDRPVEGVVLAVGPGRPVNYAAFVDTKEVRDGIPTYTDIQVHNVPMPYQFGDRVMFGKFAGQKATIDGEELLILREADIFGHWR